MYNIIEKLLKSWRMCVKTNAEYIIDIPTEVFNVELSKSLTKGRHMKHVYTVPYKNV